MKRRLTNSELSKLYPKPKTFAERELDQKEREERRRKLQPKNIPLEVSYLLTPVLILGYLFATLAINSVKGEPLLGISLMFLCGLILLGYLKFAFTRISALYYMRGSSVVPFVIAYCFACGLLYTAGNLIYALLSEWIIASIIILLLHGGLAYAAARAVLPPQDEI